MSKHLTGGVCVWIVKIKDRGTQRYPYLNQTFLFCAHFTVQFSSCTPSSEPHTALLSGLGNNLKRGRHWMEARCVGQPALKPNFEPTPPSLTCSWAKNQISRIWSEWKWMWASLHKLLQEDIKKLTKEVTKGGRSKQWEETNHPSTDYPAGTSHGSLG